MAFEGAAAKIEESCQVCPLTEEQCALYGRLGIECSSVAEALSEVMGDSEDLLDDTDRAPSTFVNPDVVSSDRNILLFSSRP